MFSANGGYKFLFPLVDAIQDEMSDCECEFNASCPAACYIEKPPPGMKITNNVAETMIGDIKKAKVLIGKCGSCKARTKRVTDMANKLILALDREADKAH